MYLGAGSSNIELRDSDELLSGSNVFGGVRLGLFLTVFLELGYAAISYSDQVDQAGLQKEIEVRTTGPHVGLGLLIPIRKVQLGIKAQRSPNNRWSQEITDVATGATDSNISGDIDYDSYFAFVRMGEAGVFELGVRRDQIRSTDSILTNSFGPYLAFNIPLN